MKTKKKKFKPTQAIAFHKYCPRMQRRRTHKEIIGVRDMIEYFAQLADDLNATVTPLPLPTEKEEKKPRWSRSATYGFIGSMAHTQ